MSTDLEQRLHDGLRKRARDAGPLRTGGATVRRAAAVRRGRRLRAAAAAGSALLAAFVVAGVVVTSGGRPDGAAPAVPTVGPTSASPTATADLVRVPVPAEQLDRAYTLMSAGRPALVAAARLPRSGDTVLVFSGTAEPDGQNVVRTVTLHNGQPMLGTLAYAQPWDDLVAQPARDGADSTLVVVAPAGTGADAVEVTTSRPGKDIRTERVGLDDRLALVPIGSPENVTRLVLLRGDTVVADRIPGDYYLSPSVPRPLGRVVAAAGEGQSVQVRTDGTTACRLTANGLDSFDVVVLPWNPIDEACATIDPEGLRLLIADDRRYSSVAGVAPRYAVTVLLHWRNGDVTESAVADDEVPAFVDTSGHRPDRLVLAEAVDAAGTVVASARP
jgi:hypothetical protein